MEVAYTMFLITKYQVPIDQIKYVRYGHIVVDCRTKNEETLETRLTVGWILSIYAEDVKTPFLHQGQDTSVVTLKKLLLGNNI